MPIFKKGTRDILQNYIPIALLSVMSKVTEREMKSRLLDLLKKFTFFFSHKQHGFTKDRTTEAAITMLLLQR